MLPLALLNVAVTASDHRRSAIVPMNAATVIFLILATLLVISSLMVVFLRRVVHCAMALVTALLLIAILFISLQAPMVGVLQVMVYAGAIMVLFLFVIMFLNPGVLEQPQCRVVGFGGGFIRAAWRFFGALILPIRTRRQSGDLD